MKVTLLKDDADDEWFGELPRDKKKRKKKSRSQRNLEKLPVVPEVCGMISIFCCLGLLLSIILMCSRQTCFPLIGEE